MRFLLAVVLVASLLSGLCPSQPNYTYCLRRGRKVVACVDLPEWAGRWVDQYVFGFRPIPAERR